MYFVYDVLLAVVVWTILVPWECARILGGKSTWRDLGERLGSVPDCGPAKSRVLLHAVSAGEVMAARPLIRELQQRGVRVVVSVGNRAGREAAESLRASLSCIERVCWLPWDQRACLGQWMRRLHVSALAVVETELWPNLFRACRDENIRLLIVNGRIYPRDVTRYRRIRFFLARVLCYPEMICVQDDAERARFLAIGATPERVEVVGNLKIDAAREAPSARDAARPCDVVGEARVLLAGSTHAPEERMLLDAYVQLRVEHPNLRLVVAPRNVLRAAGLAADARRRGLHAQAGAVVNGADVTFIDRVGVLPHLYAHADLAFTGGTLARIGGHNFLEAVGSGTAVLLGPHIDHIASLVRPFASAGCVATVASAAELLTECRRLLADERARASSAAAAGRLLQELPLCAPAYAERLLGERARPGSLETRAGCEASAPPTRPAPAMRMRMAGASPSSPGSTTATRTTWRT